MKKLFGNSARKIKWLQEGDKNTKFFHVSTTIKRMKSKIFRIQDSYGNWVTDHNSIAAEGVEFFKDQFSASQSTYEYSLVDKVIPNPVTGDQNDALIKIPDWDEIKVAVFAMNPNGAAGPDGFGGMFYVHCWDIIKNDLFKAVQAFFYGHTFPKSWTSTLIVTIPKVDCPKSFDDMRPISLCNFCAKIISKILADRMANVLPHILLARSKVALSKGEISLRMCCLLKR